MKDFMAIVEPSDISGKLESPSSKSMMIRALAASWLAKGQSRIFRPCLCRDALDVAEALSEAGVPVSKNEKFWKISGGSGLKPDTVIHVGESGLGARMFISLAARYPYPVTVTGSGSLLRRPVQMVEAPLKQLGVEVKTSGGFLPVTVKGPMTAQRITADGSQSSQFITGLLMTLPLIKEDSELSVTSLSSRPYIDLTIEVLKHFGITVNEPRHGVFEIPGDQHYSACEISVEGDWSGAAFLLVAAAVAGEITVTGLNSDSRQADRKILDALQLAGAEVEISGDAVTVSSGDILPFTFDITHCPDLAPPLVALAAYAKGTTVLTGAERLLTKESNRAETLANEAGNLGVKVERKGNTMVINGGKVTGGEVYAHNDHRIAMATAVMGLKAISPVRINNAGCVDKSYPQFFDDLKKIGGKIYESVR